MSERLEAGGQAGGQTGGQTGGQAGGQLATPLTFRELSWLEFNARVLEEARDPDVPLLERVKFVSIFSSNLDEFFMVRYAGLWRAIDAGIEQYGPGGEHPRAILAVVSRRVQELVALQHYVLMQELVPALAQEGVRLLRPDQVSAEQLAYMEDFFDRQVLPVLTPMAVDPAHPFPYLINKALCLMAELCEPHPGAKGRLPSPQHVIVPVPTAAAPRFLKLPGGWDFIALEDVVRWFLPRLFAGRQVRFCHAIRVTRDGELDLQDESDNLLDTVEEAIRKRRMGQAVRLQHEARTPAGVLGLLREELRLDLEDVFAAEGYIALTDLSQLYAQLDIPRLKDAPWPPAPVPELVREEDIFSSIRRQDILLHHPYQDFSAVNRFITEAAEDPSVLAIKMTLYRTSGDSQIAQALQAAARNGKQVAVLVELRARFNEESNIAWARRLEAAGAHVVYGIVGYKTHCKAALVVRKEVGGLRRYIHLSTGNYNESTARYYTDFGLLTCRESFGEDIGRLFNLLTGYAPADDLNHLMIAPTGMKAGFLAKIQREIANACAGRPAGIRAKLNALTDREIIEALYEAGRAGVPVRLIVRGICALKPSLTGVSENIEAISIIDRYLEHARIYAFENDGDPEYWLSSADWMSRNLNGRIEVAFPILDAPLKARLEETLQIQLSDNCKVRVLMPDSNSVRRVKAGEPMRAQERLTAVAWKWVENV